MLRKNYTTYTDEQLMRYVQRGRERAFDELYQRYGQRLFAFFWRMLGQDQRVAEDFTQQLFLKLVEKKAAYDSGRTFSTWLFTLANNMVKNEYRRRERERRRHAQLRPEVSYRQQWAHLDAAFHREQLQQALASLDEKHRQCFLLRYEDERSIREISELLEIPEGTVKSRVFYAIKYLSQMLAKTRHL